MNTLRLLPIMFLLCILASCEDSGSSENAYDMAADTTSLTGLNGDPVKLVKKAGLQIKVRNAQEAVRNVSVLVRSMGGMIAYQQINAVETDTKELQFSEDSVMHLTAYTTTADITAKVPAHHLEDFVQDVHALGYFTSNSQLSIDDQSLQYLVQHLQQQNRSTFLKTAAAKAPKLSAAATSLQVNDEIIEQERAKRQIDLDVAYSTVQLHLVQNPMVRREIKVNTNLATYQLPFTTQIANSLQSGWMLFQQFLIVIANLWMFLLSGVVLWCAWKYLNRKKQPALR